MGAATSAIIASAIIGAGGAKVAADKQARAQARIARKNLEQQSELSKRKRIAEVSALEEERTAETRASLLAQSGAQQLRNVQLEKRGITGRPNKGFADLSRSVLDEGVS